MCYIYLDFFFINKVINNVAYPDFPQCGTKKKVILIQLLIN